MSVRRDVSLTISSILTVYGYCTNGINSSRVLTLQYTPLIYKPIGDDCLQVSIPDIGASMFVESTKHHDAMDIAYAQINSYQYLLLG
jgi:hypothetical protein